MQSTATWPPRRLAECLRRQDATARDLPPMSTIQTVIRQGLERAADAFKSVDPAIEERLRRLTEQVDQTCRVAVVGRMSSGKSSFINALLGEDKAVVGTNETTATINHFVYGEPKDPSKPIRCYWLNGTVEDCDEAFLAGLQGNDLDTLRRSAGIARLEYLLPNPFLRNTILIDTPGTGAVVAEHQNVSAEFLGLRSQLRERHNQETHSEGDKASAVVYLFDAVAKSSDRSLLDEYIRETQGQRRAFNIIGVMAKIDRSPSIIEQRDRLAGAIASRLRDSVNTVVPVSALLHRLVLRSQGSDGGDLGRIVAQVRRIAPKTLEKMLDDQELYFEADCPLSEDERAALLKLAGDWSVFTTVARLAADPALEEEQIIDRLAEMSGFERLISVLRNQFFERTHIIHGFKILQDANRILSEVRFQRLPALRDRARGAAALRTKFLSYLDQARGDRAVARELADFVTESLAARDTDPERTQRAHDQASRVLGRPLYELDNLNKDFGALQDMAAAHEAFSGEESDELHDLFGMHGMDIAQRLPPGKERDLDYVAERQQYWTEQSRYARKPARREIAEHAVTRYGLLIDEVIAASDGTTQAAS